MTKISVAAAGVAVLSAMFGTGTASAAPDVVGKKYSDAVSAIEDAGGTAKVVASVGSELSQDACIVTKASDAPFVRDGTHADGEVLLALNCAGGYASATHAGASRASPQGREAKQAEENEAADEAAGGEGQ